MPADSLTDTLTLISGNLVYVEDIRFEESSYHFYLASSGEDITNDIYRRDKLALVPGFDQQRDNLRLSQERGAGQRNNKDYSANDTAPTTTGGVFVDQIFDDPLAAPAEAIEHGTNRVLDAAGTAAGQSVVPLTVILLGFIVAAYFYFQRR